MSITADHRREATMSRALALQVDFFTYLNHPGRYRVQAFGAETGGFLEGYHVFYTIELKGMIAKQPAVTDTIDQNGWKKI